MADFKIYHNPRCRKSREGLRILQDNGIEPEIIDYLNDPPGFQEMDSLLKMLGKEPLDIIRKNEDVFKTKFKGKSMSRDEWINVLISYQKLIERPIVVKGEKAVLGRPPELIRQLI